MLHDQEQYNSPFTFDPERFLKASPEPDPRKCIFGFGRRICPGQHVANNGVWIICASILAVFDLQAEEELLTRVSDIGGSDSEMMYTVIAGYSSRYVCVFA
jgi:cytochrome P450